jgi:hypothetical protein
MRVAHRKAPDYGIYGLLELLANFWQNEFLMTSPRKGKSENSRVCMNGGTTGLEPATPCVTGRRSNQLNYALKN